MPTFKCGKGVNKDLLPSELEPGVWSDANCVRSRNGFDEKVGGIAEIMTSLPVIPYAMFTFQTPSTRFLIACGIAKVYAHNGTAWFNITRGPVPVAISSIVDSTPGSTRLMTTATAHSLATGDVITVSGATGADANAYNELNATITVLGSTTLSYSGGSSNNPGGAATGTLIYSVVSSNGSQDFTGAIDDKWTGGHLAGLLILNHPIDGLFYWDGNTSNRLKTFDITTYVADVGRPHREWFFQAAPTISGTKYPRRLKWSAGAEPGSLPASFDASATNDAGGKELDDTNGFCIDIYPLGDDIYTFKDDQRYRHRYIEGTEIFTADQMADPSGLLARNCVANTADGRQVFVTKSLDVRIHSGGISESIAEGRIRTYLQGDIDATYKSRAFLCANPYTKEIWFFYPRSGQSVCNGVAMWSWQDNTWTTCHRGLSFTAATDGLLPTSIATERRMVIGTSTPKVGLVESGTTDLGATITATLERTGLHFEERNRKKTMRVSRWDFDGTAGNTASIYHGWHVHPDDAATYATAKTHTQGTTRDINAYTNRAEHIALKMTTTATDMKLRSVEIEVNLGGKF